MKKKYLALVFTALSATFSARAQELRPCATDEMVEHSFQQHPELRITQDELEQYTQSYREQINTQSTPSPIYTIPVVSNIINKYDPKNIADNRAQDEENPHWNRIDRAGRG